MANTYGSLLCCVPEWVRPILQLYVTTVCSIITNVVDPIKALLR